MEQVYEYLTGPNFKQRIEAFKEAFEGMMNVKTTKIPGTPKNSDRESRESSPRSFLEVHCCRSLKCLPQQDQATLLRA
jgi:hypothetical protein